MNDIILTSHTSDWSRQYMGKLLLILIFFFIIFTKIVLITF